MKIFNTLVCTIDDLRSVVLDYLSEDLNNQQLLNCDRDCRNCSAENNTLAIDIINEFKSNLSDFVRDFRPAPQKINIRGFVKNVKDEFLENVEISVKGESNREKSDQEGFFDLFVYDPKGKVLTFSLPGYVTKEILLNQESRICVILDAVTEEKACNMD